MGYGGLHPGFERYGGGKPALEVLTNSIGAQRGTAYDNTQPSNVYIENLAIARTLMECWSNNQRMANQFDPFRMTDFIPRWEKILGLYPNEGDTGNQRRARIVKAFARVTQIGIYQTVYDQLLATLGSNVFVQIVTTSSAQAVVYTPAGWTVGLHDPSGLVNFYSTIAHILVEVVQPAGMLDGDFYQLVGKVNPLLDNLLPAWVTFDWYRKVHAGGTGFYLDGDPTTTGTLVNLDNEAFNP